LKVRGWVASDEFGDESLSHPSDASGVVWLYSFMHDNSILPITLLHLNAMSLWLVLAVGGLA
jgi:hypothetical protein